MKLKKLNAITALLSTAALILHMIYITITYLAKTYDPVMMKWMGIPFLVLTCVHAVCGMCTVFLKNDGTRLDLYGKKNGRTRLQRITAALIFPLLILHLNLMGLLEKTAESGLWIFFYPLLVAQLIFYVVVVIHAAVSFSNAWVTLGILGDMDKKKLMDKVVYIFFTLLLLVTAISSITGAVNLFVIKEG